MKPIASLYAFLYAFLLPALVLAQEVTPPLPGASGGLLGDVLGATGQVGTPAVLICLVWYAAKTLFPRMQASHSEALKTQRDDFKGILEKLGESETSRSEAIIRAIEAQTANIEANTEAIGELTSVVLAHDMTVRGVNPDTVGSTGSLVSNAGVSVETLQKAQDRRKARMREEKLIRQRSNEYEQA